MALIVRIDVDRPYGRSPVLRHVLSRLASDAYFPKVQAFGYLRELGIILQLLNGMGARSYVFFRRCTMPSRRILELMSSGGHVIGLHLENSRSYESFVNEKSILERHVGTPVLALSKHGSGRERYGFHHYAPYEPDNYVAWAKQGGMRLFLGNLEDPSLAAVEGAGGFRSYPAAFWLEPAWRDVHKFTVDWLIGHAKVQDTVLLLHPENVLAHPSLLRDLERLLSSCETRILQ